jgi:Protein of Unknown function (DUF2784)
VIHGFLADVVVVAHMAFLLFVAAGGLLVLRWRRLAWVHLPAVVWGAWVELAGWICPLTPLENWLRRQGGESGYDGSFIEHYVLPVLYPTDLTRGTQVTLGAIAVAVNVTIYAWIWRRSRRARVNR